MKRVYVDVEAIKNRAAEKKLSLSQICRLCFRSNSWVWGCLSRGSFMDKDFSKICVLLDAKPEELERKPKQKTEQPVSQPSQKPARYQSHIEIDGDYLTFYLLKDGLPQCSGISEIETDTDKGIISAIISAVYAAGVNAKQVELAKKRRDIINKKEK